MDIFISHITEEAPLAACLKKWLEDLFIGQIQVFVSSDGESIERGKEWFPQILKSIGTAKIMIVLCSHESIRRPWVNFESGCAWMKGIPIIYLGHSGLGHQDLPPPLNFLQGMTSNDPEYIEKLLFDVAKVVGTRSPRIHPEMISEMRQAEVSCSISSSTIESAPSRHQEVNECKIEGDADVRALLKTWIRRHGGAYQILVHHDRVDLELSLAVGSTKRMIGSVAEACGYQIDESGELTSLLKKRPISHSIRVARSRPSWFNSY